MNLHEVQSCMRVLRRNIHEAEHSILVMRETLNQLEEALKTYYPHPNPPEDQPDPLKPKEEDRYWDMPGSA